MSFSEDLSSTEAVELHHLDIRLTVAEPEAESVLSQTAVRKRSALGRGGQGRCRPIKSGGVGKYRRFVLGQALV